jgi:hypothetical protein
LRLIPSWVAEVEDVGVMALASPVSVVSGGALVVTSTLALASSLMDVPELLLGLDSSLPLSPASVSSSLSVPPSKA